MTFTTKIQSFLSAHVLETGHNIQSAVDWTNNYVYTIGSPTATTYVDKFDLGTGAELAFQAATAYSPVAAFHEYPINFDSNGVYFTGFANTFIAANTSDLSQRAQATLAFNTALSQGTFSPITDIAGGLWMLCTGL